MKLKTVLIISSLLVSVSSLAEIANDNSKINERDKAISELTAEEQKSTAEDLEITRRIREDIMNHKDLSTYAQNVKIITIDGKVTLKGPVRSNSEQAAILKHARTVAGRTNVTNEMAIAPLER